jgi:hypothetical protein
MSLYFDFLLVCSTHLTLYEWETISCVLSSSMCILKLFKSLKMALFRSKNVAYLHMHSII